MSVEAQPEAGGHNKHSPGGSVSLDKKCLRLDSDISQLCFPTDSESTTVTIAALLASLNSCCNPWIYMIFSGHLLSDFAGSLPCCRPLTRRFTQQDSDSSIRRTTLLSRQQGPRLSEPSRDLDHSPKNCPQCPSAS